MTISNKERQSRYRKRLAEKVKATIGSNCIFCSAAEEIQLAHVGKTKLKGAGRGKLTRHRDVMNNPDCYEPMCRRCHLTFDRLVKRIKETVVIEEPIPF